MVKKIVKIRNSVDIIGGEQLKSLENPKGPFFKYVDQILSIIDHLYLPIWHLWRNSITVIRENLYTVDISSTTWHLPPSSCQSS